MQLWSKIHKGLYQNDVIMGEGGRGLANADEGLYKGKFQKPQCRKMLTKGRGRGGGV